MTNLRCEPRTDPRSCFPVSECVTKMDTTDGQFILQQMEAIAAAPVHGDIDEGLPISKEPTSKKLLIFDLNKVLIYRKPFSSYHIPRPHVKDFIKGMGNRFDIGVWTSMTKKNGKKVVDSLFDEYFHSGHKLLFQWFQVNGCCFQ